MSDAPRAIAFFVFLAFYALLMLTGFLRFGRQPSLHTYLFKASAYLLGGCFISVFLIGFHDIVYYFVLAWGVVACIEEMVILCILKEPRSDVKGLYWVLKESRPDP